MDSKLKDKDRSGIIYLAVNLVTGEKYVGKTVGSLQKRRKRHIYDAERGSNSHFHRAIMKYGPSVFSWKVLVKCKNNERLCFNEKKFIKKYNTKTPNGYNLTDGGDGVAGHRHSKETRQKISRGNLGKVRTTKTRQKLSDYFIEYYKTHPGPMKGKSSSSESKKKLSERVISKETREKLSESSTRYYKTHSHPMKGKRRSRSSIEATRRNLLGKFCGEKNVNSKLTDIAVTDCRKLAKKGVSHPTLAKRWGVSIGAVQAAVSGRTWKHLQETPASINLKKSHPKIYGEEQNVS